MKTKLILCCIGFIAAALVASDYTVPKSWSRTGPEFLKSETRTYDMFATNTPIKLVCRIHTLDGPIVHEWTVDKVNQLPDTISVVTGGVTNTVTNLFKIRMLTVFGGSTLSMAYNWGLVNGRESSMVVTNPPPTE